MDIKFAWSTTKLEECQIFSLGVLMAVLGRLNIYLAYYLESCLKFWNFFNKSASTSPGRNESSNSRTSPPASSSIVHVPNISLPFWFLQLRGSEKGTRSGSLISSTSKYWSITTNHSKSLKVRPGTHQSQNPYVKHPGGLLSIWVQFRSI